MDKEPNIALGVLLGITLVSSIILSSSYVSADDIIDNVAITVESSCSMSGNINTAHTANLKNSTYSGAEGSTYANGIGKTTLTTFCNDQNGFSIYAIGFTGDVAGNINLVGASTGSTIPTGTAISGDTSNWAMKVTKVDNPGGQQPDVTYNPENMTITNSFNNFHAVPDTYTKVAEYHAETGSSATDQGPGALGAKIETTYATYISADQYADIYTGQVKYVMVHPYNTAAPIIPSAMQNITIASCPNVAAEVMDLRDGEIYKIQKLADGRCWMLDNLRLDPTTVSLSSLQNSTNASNQTLVYLKNGGGSSPYTNTAITNRGSEPTLDGYSSPIIEARYKDSTTTSYGIGSGKRGVYYNYCAASAGSYCYTDKAGTGNASEDLCPLNWRLPTNSEFENICQRYNDGAGCLYFGPTTMDATDPNSLQYNLSTPLAGYFGNYNNAGVGVFWSSTRSSTSGMYDLSASADGVNPTGGDQRSSGYSIRCILNS